jgi:7-cyano-7-deazaguanine synthase in queuosine biosynthesis
MMARYMLNASGGLDSTYRAWEWMREHPSDTLLLHHCRLVNRDKRANKEDEAFDAIVKWFKRNDFTRIEVIRTSVNLGKLPHIPYDIEVLGALAGFILRGKHYRDISTLVIAQCAEDSDDRTVVERQINRQKLLVTAAKRNIQSLPPQRPLTKREMLKRMPPELAALTWSCRRPTPAGEPCGVCETCKQLERR